MALLAYGYKILIFSIPRFLGVFPVMDVEGAFIITAFRAFEMISLHDLQPFPLPSRIS